jgi:predicted dienelactone hydrolase
MDMVNPGQIDVVAASSTRPTPVYDRPLTVEVWYPAFGIPTNAPGSSYRVMTRDGKTWATLRGRAIRGAQPDNERGPFPLVIISHGYPGNRFLLSHLAENLAGKGYVVASIDHTDSTYTDKAAFGSTLRNRPLDILFVLNSLASVNAKSDHALFHMIDAERTALIGYSMGGYGVVNTVGGGVTANSVSQPWGAPNGLLRIRQSGEPGYLASMDPRIKAAIAFAPWGWNAGLWDAKGLAGVNVPVFFIAGNVDDVSGYSPGVRNIFESSSHVTRYLLTFENANHNAGAPIPAPRETWALDGQSVRMAQEHYSDPVWDNVRMNNIAQHFVTAFVGLYLRNDASLAPYLHLVEHAKDGKWSVDGTGQPQADHTYWKGFPERTALGLRLEYLPAQ